MVHFAADLDQLCGDCGDYRGEVEGERALGIRREHSVGELRTSLVQRQLDPAHRKLAEQLIAGYADHGARRAFGLPGGATHRLRQSLENQPRWHEDSVQLCGRRLDRRRVDARGAAWWRSPWGGGRRHGRRKQIGHGLYRRHLLILFAGRLQPFGGQGPDYGGKVEVDLPAGPRCDPALRQRRGDRLDVQTHTARA